jgi:hypothetical protein
VVPLKKFPHVSLTAVNKFSPELDRSAVAGRACSPHPPANTIASFENDDAKIIGGQFPGGCEASNSGAENQNVSRFFHPESEKQTHYTKVTVETCKCIAALVRIAYNRGVELKTNFLATVLLITPAVAQQAPAKPAQNSQQPPVRVTVLNVCRLSDAEAKTMTTALERIPLRPAFISDFEIARGITTVENAKSRWVRARHEFAPGGPFSTAQYTISLDASTSGSDALADTLVLRLRDPKEIVQVSVESAVTTGRPAEVLSPQSAQASRIRLERAGATSIVLARCPDQDQSARESIFAAASRVLAAYRKAFHAGDEMTAELTRPDMRAGASASKSH